MKTPTLAQSGAILQAGGAFVSAFGAYQGSVARQRSAEYDAQVQDNNAQLAEWQARDAIQRGQTTQQNVRLRTARLKSSQRAAMAANNVALDEGSPLNVLTTTDYVGELDAQTVRSDADREAWALRQQAAGFRTDASFDRSRADSESPWASAGSSLLTTAPEVARSWYRYNKEKGEE